MDRPSRTPRDRAHKILKRLKRDFPNFDVKKARSGDAIFVTLPREKVPTPVSHHHANKDIIASAISMAEKMAVSMVKETLNTVIDALAEKLSSAIVTALKEQIPQQQVVIERIASEATQKTKQEFRLGESGFTVPMNYQQGLEFVGKTGDSVSKKDDMDDILDQLSGLDS